MQRVSVYMLGSFLATQLVALAVGAVFLVSSPVSPFSNPQDLSNSYFLFAYVVVSAFLLLLLLKYYHGKLLFQAVEALMLFFSAQIVLSLFMDFAPSLLISAVLVGLRYAYPSARPVFLASAAAIVGALLGTWLGLVPAVALAILLGLYDILAVFFTKHMIELAKGLSSRGAAFSVKITAGSGKAAKLERKGRKPSKAKAGSKTAMVRQRAFEAIELGTGDLVIPAMLLVSALNTGVTYAVAAFIGAGLGMVGLLFLLERRRGYYPALPPLAGGSMLAMLLAYAAIKLLGG